MCSRIASSSTYSSNSHHVHMQIVSSGGEVTASFLGSVADMKLHTAPFRDTLPHSRTVQVMTGNLALCHYTCEKLHQSLGNKGGFLYYCQVGNAYFWLPPTGTVCKMPYPSNSAFQGSIGICGLKNSCDQEEACYQLLFAMHFIKKPLMFYFNKFSTSPLTLWMPVILTTFK